MHCNKLSNVFFTCVKNSALMIFYQQLCNLDFTLHHSLSKSAQELIAQKAFPAQMLHSILNGQREA